MIKPNKAILTIVFIMACLLFACTGTKSVHTVQNLEKATDTVRIANDSLEYEIIIIDSGFSSWISSRAYPRNYYSQSYLENKNQFWVSEWNARVLQPRRFKPNLYEMTIDYNPSIDYGYEVNYLLYNYFVYFQNTFKQNLGGNVPIR